MLSSAAANWKLSRASDLMGSESLFELLAQQGLVDIGESYGTSQFEGWPAAHVSLDGILPEQDHCLALAGLRTGQGLSRSGHSSVGLMKGNHTGVVLLSKRRLTHAKSSDLAG